MCDNATKDELIDRIKQLETHVIQLKNVIAKTKTDSAEKVKRKQRTFDFTKYNKRHVSLKIAYLGWDYQGFAVQEDTEKTIEAVLFDALLKTRLIESRASSNYHRCGRTDKGVSAFSQVISIDLRSNLSEGIGVIRHEDALENSKSSADAEVSSVCDRDNRDTEASGTASPAEEIRYVYILNRVLPPQIRVLAWCPVDSKFSARFSCTSRTYKYFFPRGNLDVGRMLEAADALVGEHDFRNLCKMDVGNGVVAYRRRITAVDIAICEREFKARQQMYYGKSANACTSQDYCGPDKSGKSTESESETATEARGDGNGPQNSRDGYDICELTIVGQAFLWHQIRCIVAVLFLIGQGRESPSVISELLDIDSHPRKPQYTMAAEYPLILYDCEYENHDIEWQQDSDSSSDVLRSLQATWSQHAVRAAMLQRMLSDLGGFGRHQADSFVPGNIPRTYKPLFERELCESLEDRIGHFAKKQKRTEKW